MNQTSEPVGGAGLYGDGTGHGGDDGGEKFYNLKDFIPIYFYHTTNF